MLKLLATLGLSVSLCLGTAHAQPAPPDDQPQKPKPPDEKAGSNESLQNGGDNRPWAAGVAAAEQQKALQLFHDGNVQLNDGLFIKAAELYREALKHWQHPAIHYNLALALMNLDQPIEVYDSLQKSISFGAGPLEKDKFEHAKEYMLLIEKQIAVVEVTCDKVGAHVSVDGNEVFVGPGKYGPAKVRAGKHTFVAVKEGYTTRINAPYISSGSPFRIELKLYTAEELTRYHRKWETKTWIPWAVIGGGVVLGVVGGVLELSAKSSFNDFDKQIAACNMMSNNAGCAQNSPGIANARDSGNTKRTLGYVGYGMAGAAVVTGLSLAYLNRKQPYQIRAEDLTEQGGNEAAVSFAPLVSPSMVGAMAQGHF
jgi:hypothetical protein